MIKRLKMSKTIMFFAMLISVIGIFCFGVMNASAMDSSEGNIAKLSEEASDHTHSYSYQRISYKHHQLKCECGAVKGEKRIHIISSSDAGQRYAECIECHDLLDMNTDVALVGGESTAPVEPHTHKYTYTSIGISQHKGYCECGATITTNHKFIQIDIGQECVQCGYVVKFSTGMGLDSFM